MPVQMRHEITETGEIYLIGAQQKPQAAFDAVDHAHQMSAVGFGKVAHFGHMSGPDDATESWKGFRLGTLYTYHAASRVAPKQLPTRFATEFAH